GVASGAEGERRERARRAARLAGWAAVGCTLVVTLWTRGVQPHMAARFAAQPWGWLFPLVAAGGLASAQAFRARGRALHAFLGSSASLAGMMAAIAFSLYPFLLPSSTDPARGLTAQSARP